MTLRKKTNAIFGFEFDDQTKWLHADKSEDSSVGIYPGLNVPNARIRWRVFHKSNLAKTRGPRFTFGSITKGPNLPCRFSTCTASAIKRNASFPTTASSTWRSKLNKIVARLRKDGKAHELPGAGLYLIDHYLHDYPELRKQWEEERGDCSAAYPPASVQSLLRTLRLQSVPKSKKLAILLYGLLDVKNSIAKEEKRACRYCSTALPVWTICRKAFTGRFFACYFTKAKSSSPCDTYIRTTRLSLFPTISTETLHERLSATSTNYDPVKMDTLNLIVKGLTKQFPPMAKEMYRQSINPELRNHPAFKTTENESFSSEPLKYDNITIGPEEIGILAELDSPLPTEVLSKKLRSRLRAMATQPAEKSEPLGSGAAESMDVDTSISVAEADSHAKAQEKTCEIESSTKVYKETKSDSIVKAGEGTKPQLTPSNETLSDPHLEEKPVKTTKRAQEKPGPADSPKPNTSSVDEMAKKLPFKEQNLSPFNLESPKAASIVSLSRIRYPEEDDEEGSEDPEEAEIPPVMEFSQMEEGLVMDSYSLADLKDQQNAEKVEEEPVGEALAEDIGQQEISGPPSDKSSSVICLDSESEGEQGNGTQLDYDYDEDSYPTDEDSYPSEEPERRRSFFHDKYNVNDPDAERALPTTADNQQQDEDRRAADVDLYDMDYNEEGIEGDNYDLFDVGRDLQQRPEADDDDEEVEGKKVEQQGPSSSCEGAAGANNADNDVEEAVEDEDQEEEEEGGEDSESESDSDSESDDSAEMISSDSEAGSGSHPTSLAQSQEGIPPTNEGSRETAGDGEIRIELSQEILKRSEVVLTGSAQETAFSSFGSSGETAQRSDVIPVGSSEETVQRSGEALTGSSSQDIMSEDPLGSTGEAEERAKTTEDAAAVTALLCLNDPPVEGNIDAVETSHEVAVVAESANTELSQVPVTPSKETIKASSPPRADDVISMLMSPDQMFFGTSSDARTRESELEICKPSLFSSAGRASFGNQPKAEDHKVEEVQVEKSPDDSNENLDLKLEESDFQCCAAPLPTDAEMTEVAMVEEVGVSSSLGKTPESDRSCASSNVDDVPFAIAQTEVAEIKSGDLPLSGEELVVSSAGEVREVITIPQEPPGIVSSKAVGGEGVEEHSHDPSEPEMPETLDQLPEESANVEGSGQSVVEIPKFDDVSSSADSQDKHVNPEIVEMPSESQSHKWDPVQIVITPDEAGALVIDEGNVIPVVTGGLLEIPKPTESVPLNIESAKSDAVNRLKVELPPAEEEDKVCTPDAQEMSKAEATEAERPANVENNEVNSEAVLQGENIVEEKDPNDGGAPEITDHLVLDASSQHKAEDRDMTPAVVPDASADFVVSILEPPTPFKTEEKSEADRSIRPEEERVDSAEMASAGDESVNPNDVAFVGDLSVPMTPTTPRTPLRKSSRLLSRLSTPGRALASDAEVMDSPSVLDVAVVDVELSDDKPQLVDRSVITEPVSKGSRRSSKAPSTGKEESADVESKSEKKRPRQSSNEPEDRKSDVVKPVKKRYRRSSSAEPELESDKMQDVATTSKSNKEATKSIRTPLKASRRSSSEEPPDSAAVKAARKSASQQSDRLDRPNVRHSPRVKPKFDYSEIPSSDSAASSVSGSVPLRTEHSKTRRAISLEPSTEDDPRRQRRASSETAQRPSSRSSSKRSSTEATFDDYEESTDFKKRKTKHSITEPLELKKQASSSKSSEMPESQAVPIPRKRGRPRSTLMPTSLASIREVPEDSPKVSRRSSVASSMTEFRNQIVQNWIASSATNIQQRKRLSRNSGAYSTRRTPMTLHWKNLDPRGAKGRRWIDLVRPPAVLSCSFCDVPTVNFSNSFLILRVVNFSRLVCHFDFRVIPSLLPSSGNERLHFLPRLVFLGRLTLLIDFSTLTRPSRSVCRM
ncbi:unnamed protein product [Nesidiocoris tenuis]|uniref:Uncharacterized protein n=1 Tax=Nesidiocoris tenuis TaxID=355587 RepID=A0A6H5GQK4_9HEMI|nr:unnamed protein product [Nesidiocoris tenuis]